MKKIFTLTIAVAAAFLSKAQDITIDFNETHVPEGVYNYDDVQMRIGTNEHIIIADFGEGDEVEGRFDAENDHYIVSGAIVLDFTAYPKPIKKVNVYHDWAFYMYHPYEDLGEWGIRPASIGLTTPLDSIVFDESPDSLVISSVVPGMANVSKIEIFADDATSIQNQESAQSFSAFPNPVLNNLTITATGDASSEVVVLNLTGKQVINTTLDLTSNHTIDFSSLPKGLYLLSVQSNDQTYTTKVTK